MTGTTGMPRPGERRGVPVRARGWGWRHSGRRSMAVAGLDLDIPAGQRVLLLGPSGSGKSTLLHALAGVLGAGEDGDEVGDLTVGGLPPRAARGSAGMVLQDPDAQAVLARVGDDVAFGCENLGVEREEIWRRVGACLETVGLDVPWDAASSELSGGQKQRLALAGVLAMRPGIILLDEPTANLDPAGVAQVRAAVAAAVDASGATLLVVEHRVEVWSDLVERVIVLGGDAGVLADGAPQEVLGRHGAELAASGVWIPAHPPARPPRPPAGQGRGAAPHEVMLTARDLEVARPARRGAAAEPVARGIDLDVRAGTVLAITGPNGAGKTTLALTLAGLIVPAGGVLRAEDALAAGAGPEPHRWRSRRLLTRIGMVFQQPEHQFITGTVQEELRIGMRAARVPDDVADARVERLLERLRLSRLRRANPFTLSGGQKRRLSVATVLAAAPRVMILDEPTFGQDAVTWAELTALMAEERDAGAGIVMVTHDAALVDALADEVLELGTGRRSTQPPADARSADARSADARSADARSAAKSSVERGSANGCAADAVAHAVLGRADGAEAVSR